MEATEMAKLAGRLANLTGRLAKMAARLVILAKMLTSPQMAVLGQVRHRLRGGTVAGDDGQRSVAVLHASHTKNAASLASVEAVVVVVACGALVAGALAASTTMTALCHRLRWTEGIGIRRTTSR